MENEYITIKEAEELTGKSDETIRRWVRLMRSAYLVDPQDENEQLEAKQAPLRKQNIRLDKHGVQQFDWLLSRAGLLETYVDNPHPSDQTPLIDPGDDPQTKSEPPHDDTQLEDEHAHDDDQAPDVDPPKFNDAHTQKKIAPPQDPPHEHPQNINEDRRDEILLDRKVYEALLNQLDVKDKQLDRKDQQLDSALERTRETNYLLRGYQERFGALGVPTEPRNEGEQ